MVPIVGAETLSVAGPTGAPAMSVRVIVFPVPLAAGVLAALILLFVAYRLARRRYQANVVKAAAALGPPVGVGVV